MPHPLAPLLAAVLLSVALVRGQDPGLRLHRLLSDHAVVQADRELVVSGTAPPAASVALSFGDHERTVQADDRGRWSAVLPPSPASATPRDLVARCGDDEARARDVLVGELWICSGQSNMVWTIRGCSTPEMFARDADVPAIRMFVAPDQASATPQDDLDGDWRVCSPESVLDFSACAYHFGRALHDALGVPIGLVNVSWGGSTVEAWTSRPALEPLAAARPFLDALAQYAPAADAPRSTWAAPDLDDSAWRTVELPAPIEELGDGAFDGIVEFRRRVAIPARWSGRPLVLALGRIDDRDRTCFGGQPVGETDRWDAERAYDVPAALVTVGAAVVAVRVTDTGGPGGFVSAPDALRLFPKDAPDDAIALAGPWRFRVASHEPPAPQQHWPAYLYGGMLHPLRRAHPRGVIFYQGENNAIAPRGAEYATVFPAMIADWRATFGDAELPFLFVQLPAFGENTPDSVWRYPVVRDAQLATYRRVPHTGMAITLDVGDAQDIHPKNKHDVGRRLARWALADVYGRDGFTKSGPVFTGASFRDDGAVVVTFESFGARLGVRGGDGELAGFEVCGADGEYRPATARIDDGRRVVVTCAGVPAPVELRYAWRNSPLDANLIGGDDLPASPFRARR